MMDVVCGTVRLLLWFRKTQFDLLWPGLLISPDFRGHYFLANTNMRQRFPLKDQPTCVPARLFVTQVPQQNPG